MAKKRKRRRVGMSLGFTVPKEVPQAPNGVDLSRYDPDFEAAMDASCDFMRRYPNAMKKLAGG